MKYIAIAVLTPLLVVLALCIGAVVLLPIAGVFVVCWNFLHNTFHAMPLLSYWKAYVILLILTIIGSCLFSAKSGTSSKD